MKSAFSINIVFSLYLCYNIFVNKKLTTDQFISKAKNKHGDLYDYSLVEYVNNTTKVTIICKEHGSFEQKPNGHMNGKGCLLCATNKIKKTNLAKYGVENPSQSKKVKEKSKQTNLKRYGVDSPSQSKDVKEKIKKTNLERYGVENPQQNKEIQEKTKKTNIERYGFENPSKNNYVIEKIKQTNNKQCGFNSIKQVHMTKILPLIKDKEWLFEQYIVLGKTAQQIGQELDISDCTIGKYLKQHEIEIRYTVGYSMKCIKWLESIMSQEGIFIQHAGNIGEFNIPGTRYKADGYCKKTNTVYEFHGDCFHGNPDLFEDTEQCNPFNDLTAKELYDDTINRENKIKELGFNLVVIWENDFNKL
jgi:hypothetical protein